MPAGIPVPGGFSGATTSGTSTAIAVPAAATQFWVNAAGDAWLAVNNSAAPLAAALSNSTPLAAGLYGPFNVMRTVSTYVHVAGRGGTPVVTVTFA
jgi:hypothetical protein